MFRVARPYQTECIDAVRAAFRKGLRCVTVEMFTGAGKGYIIANVAKQVLDNGGRVLVAVNRDNLCDQLFESLVEQGMLPKMERGLDKASPMSNLVVGSIQTMQGDRLLKWAPDHFRLVITDECHFAASKTFKAVLNHFAATYHLGLTATIERHDKAGLWSGYEQVVYSKTLMDGVNEGWLVPFSFEELPVPIQISDAAAKKKMFTEEDEMSVFDAGNYLPRLFAEAASKVHESRALMFWPNCDSSREAAAYFEQAGIETRHVDGYMSKRDISETLEWFKTPGAKTLHNSDLLSYGYDNPSIDCIGIMRISRSIPMLKQRLGRGTRPAIRVDDYVTADDRKSAIASSVKPQCRVIDLMLQMDSVKNTFADSTSLITANDDEQEYLRQQTKDKGAPMSIGELDELLKSYRATNKEKQLAKLAEDAANAAMRAQNKPKLWIKDILDDYYPKHKPASDKFVKYVRDMVNKRFGTDIGEGPFSSYQMHRIKERAEKALAKIDK